MAATWSQIRDAVMGQLLSIAQTGRAVGADGRILTHESRADLEALLDRANREIAAASRGGMIRSIAVVPRA